MRAPAVQRQQGYVLIITLLAFMGIGGAVIAGYTQQAKDSTDARKAAHNRQVLAQAKQALLMFAYNYPDTNVGIGPGRLPCPDHDNDGDVDVPLDCNTVGRFPWNDPRLDFYDARDASGERLWYAVSDGFDNFAGGGIINSNTQGTITLVDQSGSIMYDGAAAGIAAVIIAPGPVVRRDNDANGTYEYTQLRATGPQQLNPINYLDTFVGFDNSRFNNNESDTDDDGFILGPVYDQNEGMIVVNDQVVVVTADEVLAMAGKKVLETYRDALAAYRLNTGGRYPWLDDYATTNFLTRFDADINSFKGRMPTIFGDYFSNTNGVATQPIISDLRLRLNIDDLTVNETIPASAAPDIFFDAAGDLVTSFSPPFVRTYYYWDGRPDPPPPPSPGPTLTVDGVWELCPGNTGTEEDCNLDTSGNWKGPASTSSDVWLQVRRVTVTYASPDDPFEFLDADLVPLPGVPPAMTYDPPAAGVNAYVHRGYNNNTGYLTVFQEYDQDFQDNFDIQSSGNLIFDGADRLTVRLIYYPELPAWALDNDWHHSVQLAIAEDYAPDGNNADCTVNGCLVVNNLVLPNNDKISLLVIAGEIDNLVDDGAAGFLDDLEAQFEAENDTANLIYDRRAGNDRVMLLQ